MINIFNIRPKGLNVGNDAIYLGMRHYLYKVFDEVVNIIGLPATARYESHAMAGLTAKTIYEINQYGHGVIVGGGNLYENGEIDVNLESLKALDVPLMLFSLSRGRVYNRRHELVERTDRLPDAVVKALNDKAVSSLARDKRTHQYLRGIGCGSARVGGCPTIVLDKVRKLLPEIPEYDRGGVLLSVRHPNLMSIPLHLQSRVRDDITGMVAFLKSKGHSRIRILCHDHRDINFAATFPDLDYVYTGDVYSYLATLNSCELCVTYRLHSAIPCIAFDRPVIKISYDERAASLMDTLGYGDWNINMVEAPSVLEAVADRYARLGELPALKKATKPVWDDLDTVMSETFSRFARDVQEYKLRNHGR
jgi:hypothetical protein